MSARPLVFEDDPSTLTVGQPVIQKLQPGQDIDIPLAEEVEKLKRRFHLLVMTLSAQGFAVPIELSTDD